MSCRHGSALPHRVFPGDREWLLELPHPPARLRRTHPVAESQSRFLNLNPNPERHPSMNSITLPIAELKPALTGLGKVINPKATLPVLHHVYVDRS